MIDMGKKLLGLQSICSMDCQSCTSPCNHIVVAHVFSDYASDFTVDSITGATGIQAHHMNESRYLNYCLNQWVDQQKILHHNCIGAVLESSNNEKWHKMCSDKKWWSLIVCCWDAKLWREKPVAFIYWAAYSSVWIIHSAQNIIVIENLIIKIIKLQSNMHGHFDYQSFLT